MGKASPAGLRARELVKQFPDAPNRTLAKRLAKEFQLALEPARSLIRAAAGANGAAHRKTAHANKPHGKAGWKRTQCPSSLADPWEPFKLGGVGRLGIISDIHFPFHSELAVTAAVNHLRKEKLDCLLINGDCFDFYAVSRHQKNPAKRDFKAERIIYREALEWLRTMFPKQRIVFKKGNHCLTPDHEVLTSGGWKPVAEVTTEDTVAGLNSDGSVYWGRPFATYSRPYSGELIKADRRGYSTRMTPNHRVYVWSPNSGRLLPRFASELVALNSPIDIPCSAENVQPEFPIADDLIRLTGWILTDGCISERGAVSIYQSKPGGIEKLRTVFDGLGWIVGRTEPGRHLPENVSVSEAQRVRESAFGGDSLPATAFRVINDARRMVLNELFCGSTEKVMPAWVWKLSQRQVSVLLETIIDGDGTRVKCGVRHRGQIYGRKPFLDTLQSLLVVNGFRSLLSVRRRGEVGEHYVLSVSAARKTRMQTSDYQREHYDGPVHCLTMECDNFFVRHGGKVFVTGNCERWDNWLWNHAPEICDMPAVRMENWLGFDELDIEMVEDQRPIMAGKLPILHGHELSKGISAPVNPARGAYLRTSHTVLVGHSHQTSGHSQPNLWHEETFCWSVGALCDLSPEYARINRWNWGFATVELDRSGSFDVMNYRINPRGEVRKS